MYDFSFMSDTYDFFDSIMGELRKSKIESIFTLSSLTWTDASKSGHRIYETDSELYILLENNYCLVIKYLFIDKLDIHFRSLTTVEIDAYYRNKDKDLFNIVNNIHKSWDSDEIIQIETCKLEYGRIVDVYLEPVTYNYERWTQDKIISPTKETFSKIVIKMSNEKRIILNPLPSEFDGYLEFWSDDTEETILYK